MQLSQRTETRLGRLIDILYYLLLAAAFYFFTRYAFWLVFPFVFSFLVATALQKPMNFALRKFKLKKSFSAIALVLLFYLVILVIVGLIGARIWGAARSFMDYVTAQLQNIPELIGSLQNRLNELAQGLPDGLEVRFNEWLAGFTERLLAGENAQGEPVGMFNSLMSRVNLEWFKAPMSGVLAVAGRIPSIALTLVITVISSFFMTTGYDSLVKFVKRQLSPERQKALSAARRILFKSSGKLIKAYSIIIGVTFCELLLGFLLLRLIGVFDGRYLLGMVVATSIVDILPVLGVGSVLTPWAIYSLIMGNIGLGIGLLVIYAVIIVVRQVIEPKLVASNLGLPPVATIAGMYVGLQLFGFIGLLIVPMTLILVKLLNDEGVVHIWQRSAPHNPPGSPPGGN